MDLVLHIGPHKTGSTYVQHALADNRQALRRAGWLYPEFGTPANMPGHHLLAHEAETYLTASEIAKLRREVGDSKKMVLSAEGFCNWPNDHFQSLADQLGAHRVRLLYYLRDPYEQFYSYWKERVRQGHIQSLPEWFMQNFGDPHRSYVLNPLVHLDRYRALDPRFELQLISYETLRRSGQDIVDPLWRGTLEVEEAFVPPKERLNRSLSIEATEFLRMLIEHYTLRHPDVHGRVVRHAFTHRVKARWGRAGIDLVADAEAAMRSYAHDLSQQMTLSRRSGFYRFLMENLKGKFSDTLLGSDDMRLLSEGDITLDYYNRSDLLSCRPLAKVIESTAREIERSKFVETVAAERVV